MFGRLGKDDFFGDGSDRGDAVGDSATEDPWDFWAHEPTRPIQRVVTRRTPSTPRKRRNRSHGQTEQIRVIELDDTACRPYDADTGLGGKSASEFAARSFDRDANPLLRRVGAMMVLLSLGVPFAMALRGGESGRDDLGFSDVAAIAATQTAPPTVAASVDGQVAGSADSPAVTAAGDAVVSVAAETAAPAPTDTAAALPAAQPAGVVAAPPCAKTYEVVLHDGWLLIAAKHSITVDELLAANAANLSTFLMVGSTICVPANASAPTTDPPATTPAVTQPQQTYVAPFSLPCAKTYVVVLGDGWLRIANKHGVAMKDVLAANAANASTFLMVGRKICVPANATTPTTAAPPTTKKNRPPPEPTLNPPTRTYTPAEVEAIIREVWPDDLEEEALRIAKRESRLNPRAQNYCCWGLFQIYFNVHKKWLAEMGITSGEQLLDPVVAAQAGYRLYQRNGWGPWKL